MNVKIKRGKVLAGMVLGKRPLTGPRFVLFRINHTCNMKCTMCASFSDLVPAEHRISRRDDMDFDLYRRLIDDCIRLGVERVSVGGEGEPSLHPHFMDMLRYAKDNGLEGTTITNGSRLSRENVEKLVDMQWDELNVSMNAGNQETHEKVTLTKTWNRIRDGLAYLHQLKQERRQERPFVRLSNTVFNTNHGSIVDMVRFAIETGADEMTVGLATLDDFPDDGRHVLAMSPEEFRAVENQLRDAGELARTAPRLRHNIDEFLASAGQERGQMRITESIQMRVPCTVGYWLAVIDPDGKVHPCCQCEPDLGRVTGSTSFGDIWRSEAYAEFRRAAWNIPKRGAPLDGCTCHSCDFTPANVAYYNKLHPLAPITDRKVSPRR
jgi:radical SAM protein with 4Fe4S-binding SPASM domain